MKKTSEPTEQTLEDSVVVGIISLFPEIQEVIPGKGPNGRVSYLVRGDIAAAMRKLYQNAPLGSLDVLKSVKSTRQMIFNLKA